MFFRFIDPLLTPFRRMRSKAVQVKNVKGNMKADANRVKNLGRYGKGVAGQAGVKVDPKKLKNARGAAAAKMKGRGGSGGASTSASGNGNASGGRGGGGRGNGGGRGAAAPAGANRAGGNMTGQSGNPNIIRKGLLKRRFCAMCNSKLHKTWDYCPYCQNDGPAPSSNKTQAFMMDQGGLGGTVQLLGWLVPVQGAQRGELFTLAPVSMIGTDEDCTVVLYDQYMSAQHAEIKAESGGWVLRDLGSTNGTYVNDKRIESHELVDNDFVKFGNSLVKFKSL